MTAFLKIDRCRTCGDQRPWEWVPPVELAGRPLAGTGVWRSALLEGLCARCHQALEQRRAQEIGAVRRRQQFTKLVGARPCREYTFERYVEGQENHEARNHAERFDPSTDNLYLWGPCGAGKTHLAIALLRRWFGRGRSVALVTPAQLIRKLRMKTPEEEQLALDQFVRVEVLAIDDVGCGAETPYARQVLQEILDARHFGDRGGLVVTSQFSPRVLARRWADRAVPSRLTGMCRVIEIRGPDRRECAGHRRDAS